MARSIAFVSLNSKVYNYLQENYVYLLRKDFESNPEAEFLSLEEGIALTERKIRAPLSENGRNFSEFANKFKLEYFLYVDGNYGGYTLNTILTRLSAEKQQAMANLIGSLLVSVKKSQQERQKIEKLISDAGNLDRAVSYEILLELKKELIEIYEANKGNALNMLTELNNFRVKHVESLQGFIRVFVQILNANLIGHLELGDQIPLETLEQIEEVISSGNISGFIGDYKCIESIFTLIGLLPRPKPSGKFKMISELLTSLSKFVKDRDLKKILRARNISNLEAIIEMILFPIQTGVLTPYISTLKTMFNKKTNLDLKELVRIITQSNSSLTFLEGLVIHRNPIRLESTNHELWGPSFCADANRCLGGDPTPLTEGFNSLIEDTKIGNTLNAVFDAMIASINKEFQLCYTREYLSDILKTALDMSD